MREHHGAVVDPIIDELSKLFDVEVAAADRGIYGTEARPGLRQAESGPLVDRIVELLHAAQGRAGPRSTLGQWVAYATNQEKELRLFLGDPKVALDNNVSERALRIVAPLRKNALFVGHDLGGQNLAMLLTIVSTCVFHGVEPRRYAAACGETVRTLVGDGELVEGAGCTGILDADPARLELALSGADLVSTRASQSPQVVLDKLRTRDLSVLLSLGFDEAESYDVQTRDVMVTDAAEDGKLTRAYLGTMTFVSRGFGDQRALTSRAVVVREAAGELAVVVASWPALDETTELISAAPTYAVEDYPKVLGIDPADIEDSFGVLDVDGAISTAREVVAVAYRVAGPDGSTAGVVRYFDASTLTDSGGAP